MIVHCNFEELSALKTGARQILAGQPTGREAVAALPGQRERVAHLLPRLVGDLSIQSLADQRALYGAVASVVQVLRMEMEEAVADTHPAHEGAVSAYFDFAHALSVLSRLEELGRTMEALIELVTEGPVTDELAAEFGFPT